MRLNSTSCSRSTCRIPLDKKSARKYGLARRAAIPLDLRAEKDRAIQKEIISMIEPVQTVGCYVSMKDEVNTWGILQDCLDKGKSVAVPKVTGNTLVFHRIRSFGDLKEGTFGVREPYRDDPVEPEDIDFMIVPLSCFDEKGNRTGYGKGYYDSILKRCPYKAGIAYSEQKTDQIEPDPWDIPLDTVIYR